MSQFTFANWSNSLKMYLFSSQENIHVSHVPVHNGFTYMSFPTGIVRDMCEYLEADIRQKSNGLSL